MCPARGRCGRPVRPCDRSKQLLDAHHGRQRAFREVARTIHFAKRDLGLWRELAKARHARSAPFRRDRPAVGLRREDLKQRAIRTDEADIARTIRQLQRGVQQARVDAERTRRKPPLAPQRLERAQAHGPAIGGRATGDSLRLCRLDLGRRGFLDLFVNFRRGCVRLGMDVLGLGCLGLGGDSLGWRPAFSALRCRRNILATIPPGAEASGEVAASQFLHLRKHSAQKPSTQTRPNGRTIACVG